jgi:hypothetical protein
LGRYNEEEDQSKAMNTPIVVAAGFVVLALVWDGASAQSLVDVARREAERRKSVAAPAKVYTGEDVQRYAGVESAEAGRSAGAEAPVPQAQPSSEAGTLAPPAAGRVAPADAPTAEQADSGDEARWKGLIGEARLALDRSRGFLQALQTRAEVLASQFAAQGDQSQRAAIAGSLTGVRTEIDRLQTEINQKTQELTSLEEQARRAGVPPGLIRRPQP